MSFVLFMHKGGNFHAHYCESILLTLESPRIRIDFVFRNDGKWNNRNKIVFCFVCSEHLSSILALTVTDIFTLWMNWEMTKSINL